MTIPFISYLSRSLIKILSLSILKCYKYQFSSLFNISLFSKLNNISCFGCIGYVNSGGPRLAFSFSCDINGWLLWNLDNYSILTFYRK